MSQPLRNSHLTTTRCLWFAPAIPNRKVWWLWRWWQTTSKRNFQVRQPACFETTSPPNWDKSHPEALEHLELWKVPERFCVLDSKAHWVNQSNLQKDILRKGLMFSVWSSKLWIRSGFLDCRYCKEVGLTTSLQKPILNTQAYGVVLQECQSVFADNSLIKNHFSADEDRWCPSWNFEAKYCTFLNFHPMQVPMRN